MTSNDRIQNAIDALDKVTSGPWCPHYIHDLLRIGRKSLDITTDCDCLYEPDENDTALIAAAPDLAAEVIRLRKWQSEAVQYLDDAVEYLRNQIAVWEVYGRHKVYQSTLDNINRLIAEAEEE